ncbi:MAG: BLUF domain-containing protein [Cytophagales bacterium]|nr:BLUF domain-containing protein [Rhizobacter sp.]
MSTTDLVSCVLWVSRLSPEFNVGVVKQIWQSSRQRNATLDLTGTVIFDGERFCELLEGPLLNVSAVYRDVEFDPRHTELRVLHMSSSVSPRRLTQWRSGYGDASVLDLFCGENGRIPLQAVSAFLDLLPGCDLSP